jgi:hypothetical protein
MGILDTMKEVVTLVQKIDNIEILKQVLALQSQVFELQAENQALRTKAAEMDRQAQFAKTLEFETPFYYAENDKVPFCARCWEAERSAIHLKSDWNGRRWECYSCKNVYLLDETARPKIMFDVS